MNERFEDEDTFGAIEDPPELTDDELRELIGKLPSKALQDQAIAAMEDFDRDRVKTILVRNRLY